MINWGIIGLGNMANKFASSINEVKNSKLLGIASTSFFRLKSFGEKYNIDKKYRYKNYDEILNCNEINAIYISTLNNTHPEIIIKAAEAKKNILCEKPIATNYYDTIKIFETLDKSDVFFLEAIAYRSHEQTKFVINKIIEGEIGELKSIESTFGFASKKIDPKSRLYNADLGGGAILDVGCYPVSFSILLANLKKTDVPEPEILDVSGSICKTNVDETAYASLVFEKKIIAKIGVAINLQMKNQTSIIGTKGNILVNNPWLPDKKSIIEINSKQRSYKSFVNSELDIFGNQINNVSKCILDGKKEADFPAMRWRDSVKNMLVIDRWKKKLFEVNNEKKH